MYQMQLKKKEHLAKTSYPKMHPQSWSKLNKRIEKQYRKLKLIKDQNLWTNYRGIKGEDVSGKFATKYPF